MDKNSNTPQQYFSSMKFVNLQETGYGPQGEYTRWKWRDECLKNFKKGHASFRSWQESWSNKIDTNLPKKNFECILILKDNSEIKLHSQSQVPYALDLSGQSIEFDSKETSFEEAVIYFPINLIGTTFSNNCSFSAALFMEYADFSYTKFACKTSFAGIQFKNSANFSNVLFEDTSFVNANFGGHFVSFENSIFEFEVNFEGSQYPNNFMDFLSISYKNTDFCGKVNFKNLNFNVNTDFKNAKFRSGVDFENTKFNHQINFENAIFGDNEIKNYPSKINFIKTKFILDAKFNGGVFNVPAYFMKAKFFGDAEFNGAHFNQDIRFFGATFVGGVFFNSASFIGDAVKRLGQMKIMAENNGQTDQALNFNALELKAKRVETDPPSMTYVFKFITGLYEITSDYGRSFTRPIILYGILILLSFMYSYTYIPNIPDATLITNKEFCKPSENEPQPLKLTRERAAFEYAMFRAGGVMDFTDTGKQNNSVNCTLFGEPIEPPLMRAWGIFKGIASIALLFLAALGLRNKYRIK